MLYFSFCKMNKDKEQQHGNGFVFSCIWLFKNQGHSMKNIIITLYLNVPLIYDIYIFLSIILVCSWFSNLLHYFNIFVCMVICLVSKPTALIFFCVFFKQYNISSLFNFQRLQFERITNLSSIYCSLCIWPVKHTSA